MQEPVRVDDNWKSRVKPSAIVMFEKCLQNPDFHAAASFREQCFLLFSNFPELSARSPVRGFIISRKGSLQKRGKE